MLESSKVPALTRAIDILNLIARIGPCSAATIIETLGIPKSTAYLLLNELKRQRFISVDHQENFCLWTKLVELSGHALSKMDLRELARPRLTQLMDETGLLCHLGIFDHQSAYYILKVESSSTISVRSHEGKSLSLYRSGIGKCLLAWQPASMRKAIIEQLVWEKATPTTITDPQRLSDELERIRQRGWSFDNGEDYPDVRCVAAPVFNASNEPAAAISVVGTRLQINDENRDYLAGKAIACAKDISRLLGWKSPFDSLAS
ncbi:IclR family transcriptional regulator [Citrobacter rodentium]|jgi:Transcriptional regulator|uniref:Transcriptional regulator n=2 Tax=Citrobacter rodentium TaxID=67825 RepID=D2TGZ9_CITRI|nr:IclR family transcriptional regulator [Citrobacter rodentium]KIQ53079.1 IclR family transcriptional regulator [Citrobacter rodentium]QBY29137.1 IclR family transcriptional regulator [Citrobacter rodentium]UHO29009.1 IclR family transcriptional regulator [Citrobacter rodentium NBRC 105723 = DSM 16636]CBG89404.1 putative transcriptional regulator [Citrobacter rodentium ICC168]HAT8015340.1 IclR family transcriptional regulator [Citrobacter rodentium NBRC 105723 = DSM 16636]